MTTILTRATITTLCLVALCSCGQGGSTGTLESTGSPTSSPTPSGRLYQACDGAHPLDKRMHEALSTSPSATTAHVVATTAMKLPSLGDTNYQTTGDIDKTDAAHPKVRFVMSKPDHGTYQPMAEVIAIDGALYRKDAMTPGAKFVKTSGAENKLGTDFGALTDQARTMAATKAVTHVMCLGREDRDGQRTAHLRVTLDTSKLEKVLPSSGTSAKSLGLPATVDTESWIDEQDRTVATFMQMSTSSFQYKQTLSISNWGKPVSIAAPPATEVTTTTDHPSPSSR
ncbi:hypothetical protein KEM60_02014 [Austwickia sp. TVS 96-490-7B]|uniref:LppX_LprAFG lipoprotein n=1 Tax=Austwickia sp. TVS 96-490-7B TaxID=2830843 RepID=UPI001C57581B|nr:LppX_LprAFG lipoprotein [Austwickia sp. TVS 96-490-7B]MBW3085803.1 hypothetical protein [Austwickia sp. TVS 96-490-7B]